MGKKFEMIKKKAYVLVKNSFSATLTRALM